LHILYATVVVEVGPNRFGDFTVWLKTFTEPFCWVETSDLDRCYQLVKGSSKSLHFLGQLFT